MLSEISDRCSGVVGGHESDEISYLVEKAKEKDEANLKIAIEIVEIWNKK